MEDLSAIMKEKAYLALALFYLFYLLPLNLLKRNTKNPFSPSSFTPILILADNLLKKSEDIHRTYYLEEWNFDASFSDFHIGKLSSFLIYWLLGPLNSDSLIVRTRIRNGVFTRLINKKEAPYPGTGLGLPKSADLSLSGEGKAPIHWSYRHGIGCGRTFSTPCPLLRLITDSPEDKWT